LLIIVSSGGQSHRYQQWCCHYRHGITLRTIFVKSTPKTSNKKALNCDCHGMLKVIQLIQHAVTIAKF
jgi:hypothetical protein